MAQSTPYKRWDSPIVARLRRYVDLNAADIEILRGVVHEEHVIKRRRDLVVDGDQHSKLSFVKEGFAASYKLLRSGKRQIINIIFPGDVIGLPGSFLKQATFSVIALTAMTIEVCTLDDFVALCYQWPKFGLVLSWLAIQEATDYAEQIVGLGRRTSVERLAHLLLEIHARLATVGRASDSGFELPFSQEVMSDALGLSLPHLNRMLAQLRREGMISVAGRHVELGDIDGLRRLAHYNPAVLTRVPAAPSVV